MHYPAFSEFFPASIFNKLVCSITAIALASSVLAVRAHPLQTTTGLRFELPANGNLRVENLRGSVAVELWSEDYVSIAAVSDNGQPSRTPPTIDRRDALLSVRVNAGAN